MLNSYVWDLYLKSGGDKAVAFFKNNLSPSLPLAYAEGIANFHKQYSVSKDIVNLTRNELLDYIAYYHESGFEEYDVINDYLDGDIEENDAREDIDTIFDEYYQDFLEDKGSDKMVFNVFTYTIASYSTGLSITYPGLFVPYYFFSTYNVLTMIADTFGIELPEIPRKSDYKARTWHYANLCKSFYCFRKENHLSYYEFCAFLYDFAPHYIGGIDSYIERSSAYNKKNRALNHLTVLLFGKG